jgi:murein DD-endopeptidase MepM/ murein hydrolase activator NlpD
LKGAFEDNMKPVPSCAAGSDAVAGQTRQALTEVNRSKACTSAAMLGLAISMGASNMLVPQPSEAAVTNHIPASDRGNWLPNSPQTDLSSDLDIADTLSRDDSEISQSGSEGSLAQDLAENTDRLSEAENQPIGLNVREIGAVRSQDSLGEVAPTYEQQPIAENLSSVNSGTPTPTDIGEPQPSFVVAPASSSQPEYFFSGNQSNTATLEVSLPSVNQWSSQTEENLTNSAPSSSRTMIPGSASYTANQSAIAEAVRSQIAENQESLMEPVSPFVNSYPNLGATELGLNPGLDAAPVSIESSNPLPGADLSSETEAILPPQGAGIAPQESISEASVESSEGVAEASEPSLSANSETQEINSEISSDVASATPPDVASATPPDSASAPLRERPIAVKPVELPFTATPLPLESHSESQVVSSPDLTNAVVIESATHPNVSPASRIYQVGMGETLDTIAQKNNLSVSDLIAANQISDPHLIQANQKIKIPLSDRENAKTLEKSEFEQPQTGEFTSEAFVNQVSAPVVLGTDAIYPLAPTRRSKGNLNPVDSTPVPIDYGHNRGGLPSASQGKTPSVNSLKSDLIKLREKYPLDKPEGQYQSLNPELPIESAVEFSRQLMVSVPDLPAGGPSSAAPIQLSQASQDVVSETSSNGYVQGLRSDIERLRRNHQDPELANLQSQDDRLSNDPSETATDIYSAQSSDAFNQVLHASVEDKPKKRQRPGTPFPEDAKPTRVQEANSQDLLATGSSGTAAYQPLLQPTTGQMVSPQLPPLNGPEAYLPNSPAIFNGYIWPANGVFTSGYGWRWGRMHNGIDIAGPVGTPIFAAAAGVVTYAAWNDGGYGNLVEISHPDGSLTVYAHNQRILVREGQEVEQGEQVAEMGSTGFSTGPHLHFEIHPAGQGAVNPMAYLPRE